MAAAGVMTLDILQAESVGGGPGLVRIRVSGRATMAAACRLAPPTLLIADGPALRRLAAVAGTAPLPAAPDGSPFAVDFDVPLHLATGDGDWWLEPGPELTDHRVVDLAARVGALEARLASERRHRGGVLADLRDRMGAVAQEVAALRAHLEVAGQQETAAPLVPEPAAPPSADAAEPAAPKSPSAARPQPPGPTSASDGPPASPTAQPPGPTAVAVPRPPMARLRHALPAVLVATGALAVADAATTVLWQEPVSWLWSKHQQHVLEGDLGALDRTMQAPPTTSPAADPAVRMRRLAHLLADRTSPGSAMGRITIPHIHARYIVVQGTGGGSLRRGPGHYAGTSLPGEPGTVGIAGHRTTYGAPFRHIDALDRGDAITVRMPYGTFRYRVEDTRIVAAGDASSLRNVGRQRLVLTACHPLYSAAQRIVVIAGLERAAPRAAATAPTAGGDDDAEPAQPA